MFVGFFHVPNNMQPAQPVPSHPEQATESSRSASPGEQQDSATFEHLFMSSPLRVPETKLYLLSAASNRASDGTK